MKQLLTIFLFISIALLHASCTKQEVLQSPSKVVKVIIQGNTTEDLEYIYKDSVVGSSLGINGGINLPLLLKLTGTNGNISIVKKSSKEVLQQKPVMNQPFEQTIQVFYDGTKLYDSLVVVNIKGYALSGKVNFMLDGKVVYSVTGAADQRVAVLIDKNTPRTVTAVKDGDTQPLITKTIQSAPATQTLNFFFDGEKMVDNIQLTPPSNPAAMRITAKFQTTYPANFKGGDVDLVFYVKNTATSVAVKTDPEIRFTLPADGSLRSMELPPLPAATGYAYTCDIYAKGTTDEPYTKTTPFILAAFPFQKNLGLYGNFPFTAGASRLWLINDVKTLKTTTPRATYLSGGVTDLSIYFQ